jgi:amino acid transporter
VDLPESLGYRIKKRLLGPPLVNAQLHTERLSKPIALGVLAPDCISSTAYGSQEMLVILFPVIGMAAFSLLMPVTLAVLFILILLTLSYRDVVMVYTKAGGSYVVARENFGVNVAQIAAVALLIDYVVTVAVQTAAGTDAVLSFLHLELGYSGADRYALWITVGIVLLLAFGNLRGLREAGRVFALPTYLFTGAVLIVIIVGLIRWAVVGSLPTADVHAAGAYPEGGSHSGFIMGATLFIVLRAFANGGSSLTGLEAISNGVSAFRKPQGPNARRTLVLMSSILGTLVLGVSTLAWQTHAVPFKDGSPTVLAQEAKLVLGHGLVGTVGFTIVQIATALILYTGANTSFNGFPFLASFVAEDSFLPRQLTHRGHRLAFSNGIIVLTVLSLALLIGVGSNVDKLVAFYAIGVFTGFTMAAAGLFKYHLRRRERGRAFKLAVNGAAGVLSLLVVLIFAVTKFTEGAWIIVLLFPIGVFALIRLNRRYREEAAALAAAPATSALPSFQRNVVLVLVDGLDLAVIKALRYARSLRPVELRAVHLMIDNRHAEELRRAWEQSRAADVPLEVIEVPDRRIRRAAVELAARTAADGRTEVTIMLPRRTYTPIVGRLLHDRSADAIAQAISELPHVAAMIVPFDVVEAVGEAGHTTGLRTSDPSRYAQAMRAAASGAPPLPPGAGPSEQPPHRALSRQRLRTSMPSESTDLGSARQVGEPAPICSVGWRQRATVQGRVRSVYVGPVSGSPALECELYDETGGLTLVFYGRRSIPGIEPGARMRVEGMVGEMEGYLAMANPTYELLPREDED